MSVNPGELIIDDEYVAAHTDDVFKPVIDGVAMGRGFDPDQVETSEIPTFAKPSDIPLIPRSEWSDRIKEQVRTKSRISDILKRNKIQSTNQKSDGYCWAYSTGGIAITIRAINNQPYLKLNPHSVAAIIKGGANQGGWCGQSARFLKEHGIATEDFWPANSRNLKYDTPETRANMAKHKLDESWIDFRKSEWDDDLNFDQIASCLLSGVPVAGDYNWWAHSVMICDLVEPEPGDFGTRDRNSWGDQYGDQGFFILRGSKAKPDGAVGLRTIKGSVI